MLLQIFVERLPCRQSQIVAAPEIAPRQMLEKVLQRAGGQAVALLDHRSERRRKLGVDLARNPFWTPSLILGGLATTKRRQSMTQFFGSFGLPNMPPPPVNVKSRSKSATPFGRPKVSVVVVGRTHHGMAEAVGCRREFERHRVAQSHGRLTGIIFGAELEEMRGAAVEYSARQLSAGRRPSNNLPRSAIDNAGALATAPRGSPRSSLYCAWLENPRPCCGTGENSDGIAR